MTKQTTAQRFRAGFMTEWEATRRRHAAHWKYGSKVDIIFAAFIGMTWGYLAAGIVGFIVLPLFIYIIAMDGFKTGATALAAEVEQEEERRRVKAAELRRKKAAHLQW